MTIGRCQFLTCTSTLGSAFRADFYTFQNQVRRLQVLICSSHEPFMKDARDNGFALQVTAEGAVYPRLWMESLVGRKNG